MPYAPKYLAFISNSSPYVLLCSSCKRHSVEVRREDILWE